MQKQKCFQVKAVLWCVKPGSRMECEFQAQARIIDMLTEGEDKGKIWSNVLIIGKGSPGKNADVEADMKGPIMAARKFHPTASPNTIRSDKEILFLSREQYHSGEAKKTFIANVIIQKDF